MMRNLALIAALLVSGAALAAEPQGNAKAAQLLVTELGKHPWQRCRLTPTDRT